MIRNIGICVACYHVKQPVMYSNVCRVAFVCIDCFAYTTIVVWATMRLIDEEARKCKDQSEEIDNLWWVVLMLIVVGYIQMFLEWLICMVVSCIFCVLACFYCAQERSQRHQTLARFAQHAPMMASALQSLQTKKFNDLSHKVKEVEECIICFVKFEPKDDIAQLSCNERHIFHKACLEQWVKSDTTNNTL